MLAVKKVLTWSSDVVNDRLLNSFLSALDLPIPIQFVSLSHTKFFLATNDFCLIPTDRTVLVFEIMEALKKVLYVKCHDTLTGSHLADSARQLPWTQCR
jgi:hypothetical protein